MALPTITLPLTIILLITLTPFSLLASPTTTTPKIITTKSLILNNHQLKATLNALITLETTLPPLEDYPFLGPLKNLPTHGFTILAPPNPNIFLPSRSSPTNISCLRYHVLLGRYSFDLLKTFVSKQARLPTLYFPRNGMHHVSLSTSPEDGTIITLDGVRVSSPDLFVHPNVVIHGIDQVLPSAVEHCAGRIKARCPVEDEDYILSPFTGKCYKRDKDRIHVSADQGEGFDDPNGKWYSLVEDEELDGGDDELKDDVDDQLPPNDDDHRKRTRVFLTRG